MSLIEALSRSKKSDKQNGFNDQIYSPNNNYQYSRLNNNHELITTRTNIGSNSGNIQPYAYDDLDNKFIIDVKRNKDGKLEPLVRKTTTTSSSQSSLSPTIGLTYIDNIPRIDKPTKPAGIIHFPTSSLSSASSLILQQYQLQQQQQQQLQQQQLSSTSLSSSIIQQQQQQQHQQNKKTFIPHCKSDNNGIVSSSFCTQVDNYPIDDVIKAIQEDSTKFEAVFGEDSLPEIPTEISQRIDPDFGEETLCQSVERLIFPQAGMTKDNNWSFIINHENYTQGIRIEECLKPGKPCLMAENFPNGYRTECKQKYIYRQLLSMNEHGIIKKDQFQLPSCCKCYIKSY
ncbi:protein spaetzle-like [Condylostylus longicornis]|uniref:protein spaetzle-like n=1 Tax=Condylostylus longicornis TaxID=2530218 RepID=UPI00244DFBD9|nr:protein spaetzle-like [Condylostylus longicornis]